MGWNNEGQRHAVARMGVKTTMKSYSPTEQKEMRTRELSEKSIHNRDELNKLNKEILNTPDEKISGYIFKAYIEDASNVGGYMGSDDSTEEIRSNHYSTKKKALEAIYMWLKLESKKGSWISRTVNNPNEKFWDCGGVGIGLEKVKPQKVY